MDDSAAPTTGSEGTSTASVAPEPNGAPTGAEMPLGSALYSQELKSHPGLAKFMSGSVDTMARSLLELDKFRRDRSGVKPLTPESTPEEITAYRAAMGIPEKPDGYEVGELHYPEEEAPTEAAMGEFKSLAHSLHLTPAQVQGILDWHAQHTSAKWNAIDEQRKQQNQETWDWLVKERGSEAGQYAQLARDTVFREFGEEGLEDLNFRGNDPTAVGSSPTLLKILMNYARLKGHDRFRGGDGGSLMSKEVAQQKIAELRAQYREKRINDSDYASQYEQLAKVAFSD